MGFRGLMPADKLSAVYDPVKQVLTLAATGVVQNYTYGYKFERMPFAGGLRFELVGWTGPIGPETSRYDFSQPFSIPGLTIFDPSKTAVIVTANHTDGQVINIKFLGLQPPKNEDGASNKGHEVLSTLQGKLLPAAGDNEEEKPALPQTIDVPTPVTINALFKQPFDISEKIRTAVGATLHVDFDTQMLSLTSAGVDDGSLTWVFNSVQTGDTQVITYSTTGLLCSPIIRKVYSVKIFVLDAATAGPNPSKTALLAASNGHSNGNGVKTKPTNDELLGAILTFLGRVAEAQHIAQALLPSSRLLRVVATDPSRPVYPPIDPLLLPSQLSVLFVADNNQHVTVNSTGWGEWAPPVVQKGPVLVGLLAFDLDVVKVDLRQAVQAVRASGNEKPIYEFSLSQPFGSPDSGPYKPMYNFRMFDYSYVSVDSVTGKVVGK